MEQKENKISNLLKLILESIWLIVAVLALIIAIKETISFGLKPNLLYYLFSAVAVFFYFTRRKQRLKNKN